MILCVVSRVNLKFNTWLTSIQYFNYNSHASVKFALSGFYHFILLLLFRSIYHINFRKWKTFIHYTSMNPCEITDIQNDIRKKKVLPLFNVYSKLVDSISNRNDYYYLCIFNFHTFYHLLIRLIVWATVSKKRRFTFADDVCFVSRVI